MTTRRKFLKRFTKGLAGLALSAGMSAWAEPALARKAFGARDAFKSGDGNEDEDDLPSSLPIFQAWTTETETEIKVVRDQQLRPHYEACDSLGQKLAIVIKNEFQFTSNQPHVVDHLFIQGLKLGEKYQLSVYDGDNCLDQREFSALDLRKTSARIALISCMRDFFWLSQKFMWAAVSRSKPDLILLIGDACYADEGSDKTPEGIWRRHCESLQTLDAYSMDQLIPILAVWDDHDFGWNDGNGTFPYKDDTLRMFDGIFGSLSTDRHFRGPAAHRMAYAFGLRIALMDDRYFRTPVGDSAETHWGEEQENYLAEHLGKGTLPTLLCNGNQFFGGYQSGESYERDHPKAFQQTLKRLASAESPILFCSGDVHYSELMKIEKEILGYPTFELTSSSMHSFSLPWTPYRHTNPRRLDVTWHHNFLLIQTQIDPTRPSVLDFQVDSIGKLGRYMRFSETLTRR